MEACIESIPKLVGIEKSLSEKLISKTRKLFKTKYSLRRISVILIILMLSLADTFFTLLVIEKGGTELNPIMNYAIEKGTTFFIASKYALTSIGLLVLCAFGYKKLAKNALAIFLALYLVLIYFHIHFAFML